MKVTDDPIQPGARVIELAGVTRPVAILTGVVAATIVTAVAKHSWVVMGASRFIGAGFGLVTGVLVAQLLYRTADSQTAIVPAGSSSLRATLLAAFAGSLPTADLFALAAVCVLFASAQTTFGMSLLCAVILAVAFALISSRL